MIEPASVVTALIVNHNGGDRILRVLEALDRQRYPLNAVIVIDNDSTDGSPDRIRALYPHVRVLEMGRNVGLSAARNAGLAAAETPYALLLDHDIYVEDGCIETLAQAQAQSGAAVVCPRIRLTPERDIVQADGAALHFLGTMILLHDYRQLAETPVKSGETQGCIGACMFVDRAKVIDAGGFDPLIFFYLEDHEFSLRMRSLGHRFWCEATAEVFHERSSGTPGLSYRGNGGYPVRRAYFTMRHRLLTMLVHYRIRTLIVLAPALILYEIASVAAAIRKGWLWQWVRAWGWQLRNLRPILARRRRMQRSRQRDDRELLVGGAPPLAPGFLASSVEAGLVKMLGAMTEGYWQLTRRWIG